MGKHVNYIMFLPMTAISNNTLEILKAIQECKNENLVQITEIFFDSRRLPTNKWFHGYQNAARKCSTGGKLFLGHALHVSKSNKASEHTSAAAEKKQALSCGYAAGQPDVLLFQLVLQGFALFVLPETHLSGGCRGRLSGRQIDLSAFCPALPCPATTS